MTTVSLKISEQLLSQLNAAARSRSTSRSALVRDALESFLGAAGTDDRSVIALASDLVGAIHGPADLSTNPDHLQGFGD